MPKPNTFQSITSRLYSMWNLFSSGSPYDAEEIIAYISAITEEEPVLVEEQQEEQILDEDQDFLSVPTPQQKIKTYDKTDNSSSHSAIETGIKILGSLSLAFFVGRMMGRMPSVAAEEIAISNSAISGIAANPWIGTMQADGCYPLAWAGTNGVTTNIYRTNLCTTNATTTPSSEYRVNTNAAANQPLSVTLVSCPDGVTEAVQYEVTNSKLDGQITNATSTVATEVQTGSASAVALTPKSDVCFANNMLLTTYLNPATTAFTLRKTTCSDLGTTQDSIISAYGTGPMVSISSSGNVALFTYSAQTSTDWNIWTGIFSTSPLQLIAGANRISTTTNNAYNPYCTVRDSISWVCAYEGFLPATGGYEVLGSIVKYVGGVLSTSTPVQFSSVTSSSDAQHTQSRLNLLGDGTFAMTFTETNSTSGQTQIIENHFQINSGNTTISFLSPNTRVNAIDTDYCSNPSTVTNKAGNGIVAVYQCNNQIKARELLLTGLEVAENNLQISQGAMVTLTSQNLAIEQNGNYLSNTTVNFSSISHCVIQNNGTTVTTCKQMDIQNGFVTVVHDNGPIPPSYIITGNNGTISTQPSQLRVKFIPASPSATPSITPSTTPTPTSSVTPTITPTPTPSRTPSRTPSPSITPTRTPSITPSPSVTPSVTASTTPSETPAPSALVKNNNTGPSTTTVAGAATGAAGGAVCIGGVVAYGIFKHKENVNNKAAKASRINHPFADGLLEKLGLTEPKDIRNFNLESGKIFLGRCQILLNTFFEEIRSDKELCERYCIFSGEDSFSLDRPVNGNRTSDTQLNNNNQTNSDDDSHSVTMTPLNKGKNGETVVDRLVEDFADAITKQDDYLEITTSKVDCRYQTIALKDKFHNDADSMFNFIKRKYAENDLEQGLDQDQDQELDTNNNNNSIGSISFSS